MKLKITLVFKHGWSYSFVINVETEENLKEKVMADLYAKKMIGKVEIIGDTIIDFSEVALIEVSEEKND